MNMFKLRLSMLGTLAVILGVSTLGFTLLMSFIGDLDIFSLIFIVAIFNVVQWLFAPYLVNMLYKVRRMNANEYPELQRAVGELSQRSGIGTPTIMLSEIPIPNAFAYGSPLTGKRVAVTKGLLDSLDADEVEAVIGHELGHIKHRDVQIMMFVSFLPSLFYMLARTLMFSSYYGGRDRRDSSGLALVGGVSMLAYFVLLLFTLSLSRLREYYADQHSVLVVDDGARKLSEGLAKISTSTWKTQRLTGHQAGLSGFKTLFIADPDRAAQDTLQLYQAKEAVNDGDLVRSVMNRRVGSFESLAELFSTHPNIVKRLRALNA